MQDPRDRRGEEAIGPIVELEGGPDEQELPERSRVEGEGDLERDRFDAGERRALRAGGGDEGVGVSGLGRDARAQGEPVARVRVPCEAELGEPGRRLRACRRFDLGRRQEVGERVEVVADTDPALGAGLEGCRPAPGERVQDDITRSRVARDEGVGQGGRETGEVRAHRVEGVTPQPLLVLPLGGEGDRGQLER